MQKTVYYCDQCKAELKQAEHIRIEFNIGSGIACPPEKGSSETRWTLRDAIVDKRTHLARLVHFCKVRCLNDFFQGIFNKKK